MISNFTFKDDFLCEKTGIRDQCTVVLKMLNANHMKNICYILMQHLKSRLTKLTLYVALIYRTKIRTINIKLWLQRWGAKNERAVNLSMANILYSNIIVVFIIVERQIATCPISRLCLPIQILSFSDNLKIGQSISAQT